MWGKLAKIMSKVPLMVFVATIIVASSMMLTVPGANALTQRNFMYGFDDNHRTARLGGTNVCGDHMCAPGEWSSLQNALNNAQRGNQAGWTAKSTTANSTTTNSTTTAPQTQTSTTGASSAVCSSIESMLNNAGVANKIVMQVMTDLGCS